MSESKIIFAWGSRKRAVARLRLRENGRGMVFVNGMRPLEYFGREDLVLHALEPLKVCGIDKPVDIICKVEGGGKAGQAGAMRLALARALRLMDESLTETLKKYRMLSRDPREKERMKYGKSKRRKSPQYSKR